MQLLKDRILNEGQVVGDDVLKVDMFLNHQIDIPLLDEMGKEFHRLSATGKLTKSSLLNLPVSRLPAWRPVISRFR